jgi:hypothetical protein
MVGHTGFLIFARKIEISETPAPETQPELNHADSDNEQER